MPDKEIKYDDMPDAVHEAVHAARDAQQAIEVARQVQLSEAVAKTAQETRTAVIDGLKEIFGEPDEANPEHMKIIYSKIPILCIRVDAIDKNIESINATISRLGWIVITAVILGILKLVLIP
ncbi:MAG: hypothetical protein V4436_02235 [Patescibacteria group bacterium]